MAIIRSRIIILIATISALANSASATEHTVGGDKGWTAGFDYQGWAFKQQFHVGDKLIFKYPVGKYNVFEVPDEGAMEACVIPPPEKALSSGLDVVTLETPGLKFFMCGTKNEQGKYNCEDTPPMRFYINVIPRLVGGGDPLPASTGKEHVVGDDKGWSCNVDYKAWANGKKFNIGDKLIFKYPKGKHNVFQAIDETSFKECTIPPAQEAATSGYDIITLESPDTWFMCGVGDHCKKGMKLFVHACDSGSKSPTFQGGRKLVPPKL